MKYRRVSTGKVVNASPGYVSAFPEGTYVPVAAETPVSVDRCCGEVAEDEEDEILLALYKAEESESEQ